MGGCCCCASKETVLSAPPAYYYQYPRASEEHVPLSSHQGAPSAFSGRLLVDTNLDTSSPDTYRPPPAPLPFNVTPGATQTAPVAQEISCEKNNTSSLSTNSNSVQEPSGDNHGTSPKSEEPKESECKGQTDLELDSAKDSEIELSKLEYDAENPKLTINCDHHFHLACILEWMERSESCPVCDQVMVLSPSIV
ncbi:E3 ubiquitin-protein ligase at3g02290-like protein [Trifolium pratense]|uniref:RING-type E3 ubiquitin transferase n=1 Tax=Trifolium pratense TaxID=57577 RepID=A0A2K3PBU7_TRIPR|nr:E3 ubiquitin-protein ligase at3g02290-like protein [Trifolium pratense]